tara:strand:- start:2944 stop:4917 length:1974 start_codon:yes stop_codon:yes gene_type:complete
MPNQKYNQQGGRAVNDESEFVKLFGKTLEMDQTLPPAIPAIDALDESKVKEAKAKVKAEGFKINLNVDDKQIYDDAILQGIIEYAVSNMKIFGGDIKKLTDSEEKIENGDTKKIKDMRKSNSKELKIKDFVMHVEKVFKIYVPMRNQLFPGYSKHVRKIKYKKKTEGTEGTEGTKEITTSDKSPKQQKTEQILRNFLFMFNQPTEEGGKSIFENFNTFLQNGDNIEQLLEKVDDETVKKSISNKENDDAFKLISIFAWEESGKLLKNIEKMEEEQSNLTQNGGNDEENTVVVEQKNPDQEASRQRINRIVIFICLVSYFCHGWLLITQFFRISSFITRIMDLRQQYINDAIGDFGETDGGNLFFSTYNVLWQLMSIGMVQVVVNIQQRSMSMAQNILNSTIDEARIQNQISWDRGIATYVNDLITGGISGATASEAAAGAEAEFALMTRNILRDTRHLQNDARSVHAGLVNSINGIITTTTVLLHIMNPKLITSTQVSGSIAQYTSAVFNPTTQLSGVTSISNATALMSRLGYVYLYGYESEKYVPTFSQPDEQPPSSEPSLMIRDGDINERVDSMLDENEGVENLLNFFSTARQEAAAQQSTSAQEPGAQEPGAATAVEGKAPTTGGSLKRKKGKKLTYKKRVGGSRRRSYRKKSN